MTDVNQAIELLNKYDIDITTRDVPGDNVFLTTLLPVLLTGALVIFFDRDDEPPDGRWRWRRKCQDDEFRQEPRKNVISG